MPRYFFNVVDHGRENDEEGMELPDAATARIAGISYAGCVLHNEPDLVIDGEALRVEVVDDAGQLLSTIVTRVVDAPGAWNRQSRDGGQTHHPGP